MSTATPAISARELPASIDHPPRPGMTLTETGAVFAVYAGRATAAWLCLFDGGRDGRGERRIPLTHRAHGWWYDHVDGVRPGTRYGVRVEGPWDPERGDRHNVDKLLLDPYARAVEGELTYHPSVYGHQVDAAGSPPLTGDTRIRSTMDSAPFVPRGVVVAGDDEFDWGADPRPRVPLADSVIYEAHVREMTRLHPGVPEHLRGTYAGLCHPAMIAHFKTLGITAIELLPVHAFVSEPEVVARGLSNHWGYNTLAFHAPHAAYAAAADPQGVVDEVKGMVKLLHEAGLEVLLDVVYNHTAEQSTSGATLSLRGLDARTYYRLDEQGADIDVTGCGNTVDLREPVTIRLVLDSLRHWVEDYHVDGFRFDLAVALGRGRDGAFDPNHPFLVALRADPVLSEVKLIAEPWDLGPDGWRTGQFPPPFSEWNDRFRDAVRTFWLTDGAAPTGEGQGVRELATRLAGSEDLFGVGDRGPMASVNFVTAHDGFTLADLTAYDGKHNAANGEGGADGTDTNRSWNHGVEGPSDDPAVTAARLRSMRSMLATMLFSTGVPMIAAGDEFARSTAGNNNPYCQDNALTWLAWDHTEDQRDLVASTAHLIHLRREYPALRQRRFFTGHAVGQDGSTDLAWYDGHGQLMGEQWNDPNARTLQMYVNGALLDNASMLVVVHGAATDATVTLPSPPGLSSYHLLWDSALARPEDPGPAIPPGPQQVAARSVRLYRAVDAT